MIKKLAFILYIILFLFSFNRNIFSEEDNSPQLEDQQTITEIIDQEIEPGLTEETAEIESAEETTETEFTEEQIKQLDYYKKQALKALKKGEYPYCAVMFENYLAIKNDDFKVNEYLSQVYMFMKKYPEAALILKKMTTLNPEYVSGYTNLGRLYRELGLFDESVAALEQALELKKNVEILFELGLTYERFNKLDKARSIYEEVIYILPVHAEAHFSLGLLYLREKNYEKAEREIQRAVNLNPDRQIYQTYLDKIDQYRASEEDNETEKIENLPVMPDNG